MGGTSATDDLKQAHLTQAWLATSDDTQALQSGYHFYHKMPQQPNPDALNLAYQEQLMNVNNFLVLYYLNNFR